MPEWALWLTVIGMGLITYGQRLSFIMLQDRLKAPLLVRRGLYYVPPAVLSAFIFPALFMPDGTLDISLSNYRLLAGLLAALVAWRTRNVLLTIAAGMVALWLMQYLGGPAN